MSQEAVSRLSHWKKGASYKPIVVFGAKRVGKTFLLKSFGEEQFDDVLYISFEENKDIARFFEQSASPGKIIGSLEAYFSRSIKPKKTLMIWDDLQSCIPALKSLKYMGEEKSYFIAGAYRGLPKSVGNQELLSPDVLEVLTLYPLSFLDFLRKLNKNKLADCLLAIKSCKPLSDDLHHQLLELFRLYMYTGGMPEVVEVYQKTNNLLDVSMKQKIVLEHYGLTFASNEPGSAIQKIIWLWKSIPGQLSKENKKFMFSQLGEGLRLREYKVAMEALMRMGAVYRCSERSYPFSSDVSEQHNKLGFKLYLLDTGLLSTMLDVPSQDVLRDESLYSNYNGALMENVVAQLLVSTGNELNYWTSRNTAAVEFLFNTGGEMLPVEVKSWVSSKSKSLVAYRNKHSVSRLVRISSKNLGREGDRYDIPLYLVERMKVLLE